MKINYNISAIVANDSLNRNDHRLSASSQRLASGLKINQAKDNPSGIAIGKKMKAQIRSLEQADQNSSDAISVVEIADGALNEVHAMLQRMNELAVKASTATMKDDDRAMIDEEVKQLKKEIQRISDDTDFNTQRLLDGTFDRKGYSDTVGVTVGTFSDDIPAMKLGLTLTTDTSIGDNGETIYEITSAQLSAAAGEPAPSTEMQHFITEANSTVKYEGDTVTFADGTGKELKVYVTKDIDGSVVLDLTDIGPMRVQIGANEGQVLALRIPKMDLRSMGIKDTNVLTEESSQAAIDEIARGIEYVSSARSRLGAYQNRLEHTATSLDVTQEEMTSAYSRIMDVDMAEEMTEYTNLQVLVQAGTSVLAQANERPQQVLQLLQ